jgi:hypothetical protein
LPPLVKRGDQARRENIPHRKIYPTLDFFCQFHYDKVQAPTIWKINITDDRLTAHEEEEADMKYCDNPAIQTQSTPQKT